MKRRKSSRSTRRRPLQQLLERRELLAAEIANVHSVPPLAHAIFDIGTSPDLVQQWEQRQHAAASGNSASSPLIVGPDARWRNSALSTSANLGDVAAVTWSIVPDGTIIVDPQTGLNAGVSNVVAFLDGIFGGAAVTTLTSKPWFGFVQRAYDAWADVSGLTFVYEPIDDGAPLAAQTNVGVLGVRGDMRIGGQAIDGNSNILAFNYFPNAGGLAGSDGDMIIDTGDNFFANNNDGPNGENRALFNLLTHEIGHGIGLAHVEPVDQTKLMEPFITFAFSGPQEDDIRSAHILYGDPLEPNDSTDTPTDFGVLRNELRNVTGASIDNGSGIGGSRDVDTYRFEVLAATGVSIDLRPFGTQYLEAPQGGTAAAVDRLRESDLGLRILRQDSDGLITELTTVNSVGLGLPELVDEFDLDTPGVYFIEVFGSTQLPQRYDMAVRIGRTFDVGRSSGELRLLSVSPAANNVLAIDGLNLLQTAPAELSLRFSSDEAIDEATLAGGIRVRGAGRDGVLGSPDDVTVVPGYIGFGDPTGREVVMRFASPLSDGRYRVEVFGADIPNTNNPAESITAVRKIDGELFQPRESGSDRDIIEFELELGAKVLAVVPQPVSRNLSGQLVQSPSVIHVYFDDNDLFAGGGTASLLDPSHYQLIRTNDTARNTDDEVHLPMSVVPVAIETQIVPDPANPGGTISVDVRVNRVELTFRDDLNVLSGGGTFRLKVGASDPVATAATTATSQITEVMVPSDPGETLSTATDLPQFGVTPAIRLSGTIVSDGLPFDYPGGNDELGHREINDESHFQEASSDSTPGIETRYFNFALNRSYGRDAAGRPLFTSINAQQMQRIREVYELYGQQMGIQFVETTDRGTTVVLGDLFPNGGTSGAGGVAGLGVADLVIFDSADSWSNNYGENFFRNALEFVGRSIGLGNTGELPPGTITGSSPQAGRPSGEWRFPGDHDVVHGQHLYRPDNRDVDLYRFEVLTDGVLSAETFAQRLQGGSLLDTAIRLYRTSASGLELIASNDDLYGDDSQIRIQVEPGTYVVSVAASGNEDHDPEVAQSGSGGESEGRYDLQLTFTPDQTNTIVDAAGTPIDGDADGVPGGDFNFWFKTATPANTLFVDASARTSGNGSLATPYREIKTAMAAVRPGQIVRIVGNAGADGIVGLPNNNYSNNDDNLAYELGRIESLRQDLSDGRNLIVPAGVTVMIDAGAVFKMLGSRIAVGSGNSGVDASGGVLQVLGVPHLPVFFTSHNDPAAGLERNVLGISPVAGDWGGIDIRNGIDRAEGRLDPENEGLFLNYIAGADMRYGGGVIVIDGQSTPIASIRLDAARPTLINNRITRSADAAISADPPSFEDTTFTDLRYQRAGVYVPDYDRVGPVIYSNTLVDNSINGVLVRIDTAAGGVKEELTTAARFDDTEVVHVLGDNLIVAGNPSGAVPATVPTPLTLVQLASVPTTAGGLAAGSYVYRLSYVDSFGVETTVSTSSGNVTVAAGNAVRLTNLPVAPAGFVARRLYRAAAGTTDFRLVGALNRSTTTYVDSLATPAATSPVPADPDAYRIVPDARLVIDAGIVVKSSGVRIETGFGADLIIEGNVDRPVILTSRQDDRYGAGGTFDTNADGSSIGTAGQWAGLYSYPFGRLSLDHVVVAHAGGESSVGGTSANFNAVGILQSDARITNTIFDNNAGGFGGTRSDRVGRGPNEPAVIFVTGAQPVIANNQFINTVGTNTAAISINLNSLTDRPLDDFGRQTGPIQLIDSAAGNFGPLIDNNAISIGGIAGLRVRPETVNAGIVLDDTDITHVIGRNNVTGIPQDVYVPDLHVYGGMRLQSRSDESLVVKFDTGTALVADGRPLDIDDRIGGSIQVIGAPGFPVVLTSIHDDSISAGLDPLGRPVNDTNGDGATTPATAGDWRGIELLEFSNDRNVETVIEAERNTATNTDTNATPQASQNLGLLARGERDSDENLRLGFSVYGTIGQPADVDTYAFRGTAGTLVWLDIDRTDAGLDSIVEVVDGAGNLLARSVNSAAESAAGMVDFAATGITALPMNQAITTPRNDINGSVQDPYTLNPLDAGMRFILPGTIGTPLDYFVRVRSQNNSTGVYQLQVRLRQTDEIGGSTVRQSEIRFADVGILTRGLPGHSPLAGDGAAVGATPINLGNIGNVDRAALTLSGNLTGDRNVYQFEVRRDSVQSATGQIAATFDIDYADGLGRPDTTLLLYSRGDSSTGQPRLVMIAHDSNVASDQPTPTRGNSLTDLSRGSAGIGDPFLGTVMLNAGFYDVVVTSKANMPVELEQFYLRSPSNPNVLLLPSTSVAYLLEDRLNGDGPLLNDDSVVPYTLGDVSLFAMSSGVDRTSRLSMVNPQIGDVEAHLATNGTAISSAAFTADYQLRVSAAAAPTPNDANSGGLLTIDPTTGAATAIGTSGLTTWHVDPDDLNVIQSDVGMVFSGITFAPAGNLFAGEGFGVASRGDGSLMFNQAILDADGDVAGFAPAPTTNYLYRISPTDGAALDALGANTRDGDERAVGAGTQRVELGRFDTTDSIIGLTTLNDSLLALSHTGRLFSIQIVDALNSVSDPSLGTEVASIPPVGSAQFTALTRGPIGLPGYEDMLFAADTAGNLYAFNAFGVVQEVLLYGSAAVNMGLLNVKGLAFGPLTENLWSRNDVGGVSQPTTVDFAIPQIGRGRSFQFDPTSPDFVFGGESQGQLISNTFDLSQYVPGDLPMLYFQYMIDTEAITGSEAVDSFRVFASSRQSPTWALLGTNNTFEGGGPSDDELDSEVHLLTDQATGSVPLFNTQGDVRWRQARVSLSQYSGHQDVTLRFEFNTAGESEINVLELTAVSPGRILDSGKSTFTLAPKNRPDQTYEFDFGLVLRVPSGVDLVHNSTLQLTDATSGLSRTFTMRDSAINPATGPLVINYDVAMSSAQIRDLLVTAISGSFPASVDPESADRISIGSSINVVDLTASTGFDPAIVLDRPGILDTTATAIPIRLGQSVTAVRNAIRTGIAASLATPGATPATAPFQVHGDLIKLFGVNVVDIGPLRAFGGYNRGGTLLDPNFVAVPGGPTTAEFVPGSRFGLYRGTSDQQLQIAGRRNAANNFSGISIDDFIIAPAERGEMVLNAVGGNVILVGNPDAGTGVRQGEYQLEIRLTPVYANGQPGLVTELSNDSIDHAVSLSFVDAGGNPIRGGDVVDGARIQISDGSRILVFEMNDVTYGTTGNDVGEGMIPVPYTTSMTPSELAVALRDAINRPEVQASFGVAASLSNGLEVLLHGPAASDLLGGSTFTTDPSLPLTVRVFGGPRLYAGPTTGDGNRFRDQGQVVLQGNTIVDSLTYGIIVDAGLRNRDDRATGLSETLPRPGTPRSFLTANPQNLVPGVSIINNVLAGNTQGGIRVRGDAIAPVAAPQPFARIVNNTIYGVRGTDTGVSIEDRAAPTLVNNALVNLNIGINRIGNVPDAEVFGTLFAGNQINSSNGNLGAFALTPNAGGLFEDVSLRNFYPIDRSALIDSGQGAIDDRFALASLRQSLNIAPSPILAPQRDITGQRRVDDPNVNNGSGTGVTVFIDRGAFDRSDVIGPRARLTDPLDNAVNGVDGDPLETFVRLESGTYDRFTIKLEELEGTGTDDSTVTEASVLVSENGRRLIPGVDYTFGYSLTSNTITLTPTSGLWNRGSAYEITLNNRDRVVAQASDGLGVFDGETFDITDDQGNVRTFEFESGYVLNVSGPVADGDRIVYRSGAVVLQFELDSDGVIGPASSRAIPFEPGDTVDDIAAAIAFAFVSSNLGFDDTIAVENGRVLIGGSSADSFTVVSGGIAITGSPGVAAGHIAVPFAATRLFSADTMAGQIIAAINRSGLRSTVFAPGGGTIWMDRTAGVVGLESGVIGAIRDLAGNELEPNRPNRETQFTILMPGVRLDFGDAPSRSDVPDGYLTRLAENGPRHTVSSDQLPRLGLLVDTEADAYTPGSDDEVSAITVGSNPGGSFQVTTLSSTQSVIQLVGTPAAGDRLTMTIDSVPVSVELLLAGQPSGPSIGVLFVPGEPNEVLAERIATRLTEAFQTIAPRVAVAYDRGSTSFTIASLDDEDGVKIGSAEVNGMTVDGVFVDPTNGDLLSFLNPLSTGGSELIVDTTGGGLLDAWVDFNGDGDFGANEQVLVNQPVLDGRNTVRIVTPSSTVAGAGTALTWARFRISNTGNLTPQGAAIGGEVEDHRVLIAAAALPVPEDDVYVVDEDELLQSVTTAAVGSNDLLPSGLTNIRYEIARPALNGTVTMDSATGQFEYQGNEDFFGADFFTYRVVGETTVDGIKLTVRSATVASVNITVNPINDAPFAVDHQFVTTEPSNTTPPAPVTVSAAQMLTGALPQSDADLRLPPFDELEQSLRVVQIRVRDDAGGLQDVVPNSAPLTPIDGNYVADTYVGGVLSGNVTVFVVGNRINRVIYQPAADYNEFNPQVGGATSTDGFVYVVADDGQTTLPDGVTVSPALPAMTTSASVIVRVTPQNDPPTATPDVLETSGLTIQEDTDAVIPRAVLLANDFAGLNDGDDESLGTNGNDAAVQLVTAALPGVPASFAAFPLRTAAGGRVSLNADGDLVYRGPADYFGPDSFSYTIVDSGVNVATDGTVTPRPKFASATVSFIVRPVNDAPSTTAKSFTAAEDSPLVITALELIAGSAGHAASQIATVPQNEANQTFRINQITASGVVITAANSAMGPFATPHGSITTTFDSSGALVSLTYLASQDFNADNPRTGTTRTLDEFSFTVQDDGIALLPQGGSETTIRQSVTAAATILVTPQNDTPVAQDDLISATSPTWLAFSAVAPVPTEDTPLSIPIGFLLGNDAVAPATAADELGGGSANDGSLRIIPAILTTTLGGTVVITASSVTYTPPANVYGRDTFTYSVTDTGINEAVTGVRTPAPLTTSATVTIDVIPVNDRPVGVDRELRPIESGQAGQSTTLAFTADDLLFGNLGTADDARPGDFALSLPAPFNESAQSLRITEIRTSATQVANAATVSPTTSQITLTTVLGGTLVLNFIGDRFDRGTYTAADGDTNARSPFAFPDLFTFIVSDDGRTVDPNGGPDQMLPGQSAATEATARIVIQPTNDAPTFDFNNNVVIDERDDNGETVVRGWARNILPGPATARDESERETVTFAVDPAGSSIPAGLFTRPPVVSSNGTLTIFPATNQVGTATIRLIATDASAATGFVPRSTAVTFTIQVVDVNDPPTFVAGSDVLVDQDSGPYSQVWATMIAPGPESEVASGQTVRFEVEITGEAGDLFTVAPSISETGVLTFTPGPTTAGVADVSVTAIDSLGGRSAVSVFRITINNLPDSPVAVDDTLNTNEDAALLIQSIDLLANDTDADLAVDPNESLRIVAPATQVSTRGVTITFDEATGSFLYDATTSDELQSLRTGQTLTDSFTYAIEDRNGESPRPTATVTIIVTGRNDAPRVQPDSVAVDPDGPTIIRPLLNDSDIDGTIDPTSIVLTEEPQFGAITIVGDGTLRYTPGPDFTGTDSFRYTVADNNGQQSVQTVVRLGEGPIASDVLAGTSVGRATIIDPAAGISSQDPLDLSKVRILSGPDHGTLTTLPDGRLQYTPEPDYRGEDRFVFDIADTQGVVSNPSTVTLRVVNSNLQNPLRFSDVNADSRVSALDALIIINRLNRAGNVESIPVTPDDVGPNYFDQNGDLRISALDALRVINELNRQRNGISPPSGEGEGAALRVSSIDVLADSSATPTTVDRNVGTVTPAGGILFGEVTTTGPVGSSLIELDGWTGTELADETADAILAGPPTPVDVIDQVIAEVTTIAVGVGGPAAVVDPDRSDVIQTDLAIDQWHKEI